LQPAAPIPALQEEAAEKIDAGLRAALMVTAEPEAGG
jgi:hypothetical protein